MATKAPVSVAAPERSPVGSTVTDSFLRQPDPLSMHVTRPKSAKGRTRPRLHRRLGMEGCSGRAPPSLPPAIPCESPSSQKPGACTPKSPDQGAPSEIPELLQQMPIGASSSLNKYPVLPSIHRRTLEEGALETVAKKASSLRLSSAQALSQEETCITKTGGKDPQAQACSPEGRVLMQTERQTPSRARDLEEPSDQEPRLLLAIRSPSGRRFVRHFRPTDDLQTVVAVAEHKNKATYRHCSVEMMGVPRRHFSDLSKSLQDCGVPNKSVLGISQEEGEGWS